MAMACRLKTPAKVLFARIKTRHQSREESMASSWESCRQPSREEGKAPSNYSAAKVAHCCCLCFLQPCESILSWPTIKGNPGRQVGATRKTHLVARCWYACFPSLFNKKWLESLQEILCYTILESGYIIVKYRLPAGTQATVYIYLILLFVSAPECRDIETALYDRTSVRTYVRL